MEETVAMETRQTVDAPAENEDGYEKDLLAEEWQDSEPTVEETAVDAPEAAKPQRDEEVSEQTRIDRAMYAEKRRVAEAARREAFNHPAYQAGNRILSQIMQTHKTDLNGALEIFNNNYIASIAEQEGVSENVARALFGGDIAAPAVHKSVDEYAADIRGEIETANLPDGFVFNEAIKDEEFARLLLRSRQNPAELAAYAYHLQKKVDAAPREMADRIRARQAIPQPIKAAPTNPIPNVWTMTDDEFAEYMRTAQ